MSRTALMIHGGFCGGWYFAPLRQAFEAAGWTCLAPDLPYHDRPAAAGAADPRLAACGVADYTAAMAALVDRLEAPPVVVGHSLGGLIAQQLAAQGRARAAVLLAPAAPWGLPPATRDEVAAALGLLGAGQFWTTSLNPAFEVAAANSLDRLPPAEQRQVFERLTAESGRVLFETMFWPYDLTRATAVAAEAVECPLLCVAGGDDKVISPATVQAIAGRYDRHASYAEFPGVSHWMIGEPGWDVIGRHCLDWLAALPA